jgi:hypothetical protein
MRECPWIFFLFFVASFLLSDISAAAVPSVDLRNLQRQQDHILQQQEKRISIGFGFTDPFAQLNKYTVMAETLARKSEDVELYGFRTVVAERMERARTEWEKGKEKLNALFLPFAEKRENGN